MKHIIDTEQIEKLETHLIENGAFTAQYIALDDLRAILEKSPSVSDRVTELEAKLKVASEALENIVKHFDLMGKSITEYSITYQIATEALAKHKKT